LDNEYLRYPKFSIDLRAQSLKRFEAESIEIMREVLAELKRPVMLYSIGKDSSVLLYLVGQ
jgi:sulfate adenylyltransferase subunit 2